MTKLADIMTQLTNTDYSTKFHTTWFPILRHLSENNIIAPRAIFKGLLDFWKC